MIRELQEALLASTVEYFLFGDTEIAARVRDAFFAVPRHLFVKRFRDFTSGTWHDVTPEHLPLLYRDGGLAIGTDVTGDAVTISGPAWVLYMLTLLDVQPGHRVFEVGTGSGYNAALLGELAGPKGYVETYEIIPELAAHAREVIPAPNVHVVAGDAGAPLTGEPFDRVVFTAGAYDIPAWMHDRVRVGGLLCMSLKLPGAGDYLVLFRRHSDGYFESISARSCEVVWMRGVSQDPALAPLSLDAYAPDLRTRPVRTRPFAFGGAFRADFAHRTHALCSYLGWVEPRMRWFTEGWPHSFFGLHDADSLVIARDGQLASFGGLTAEAALVQHIHDWVDRGMPSAETVPVRAYRAGTAPPGGLLVRRAATDFVWAL